MYKHKPRYVDITSGRDRYEKDDEKSKTKRSFSKTIVFLVRFLKMVVFIKFVV